MKHRIWVLMVTMVLGGCVDPDYGPGSGYVTCGQLTTCGSCTPVLGCGWCTIGNAGVCVSEPNACWRASKFEFTWEPSGCPGAEAGAPDTKPSDAAADGGVSDSEGETNDAPG